MRARYFFQIILVIVGLGSCSKAKSIKDDFGKEPGSLEVDKIVPDLFFIAIRELEAIGFYRKMSDCNMSLDSGYCCLINPADNWLTKSIADSNRSLENDSLFNKSIKPIKLGGLKEIKSYFVVGNYEVQKNIYPRAAINEWTFDSIESTKKTKEQLDKLTRNDWFYISKTPITWWTKGNKIYFILPSGHFVLTEVSKIEKKLKERL